MCSRSGSTSPEGGKAGPTGWTMVSTRPCLVQMPARPSILRNIRYLSPKAVDPNMTGPASDATLPVVSRLFSPPDHSSPLV